jgi:hypothetical protein
VWHHQGAASTSQPASNPPLDVPTDTGLGGQPRPSMTTPGRPVQAAAGRQADAPMWCDRSTAKPREARHANGQQLIWAPAPAKKFGQPVPLQPKISSSAKKLHFGNKYREPGAKRPGARALPVFSQVFLGSPSGLSRALREPGAMSSFFRSFQVFFRVLSATGHVVCTN